MRHEEWRTTGARGLQLCAQSWAPDGEAIGVVVIVHGFAEHGGRYTRLAARLVAHGYAVRAGDLRGHGRSEGRRTSIVRFADYTSDVCSAIADARRAHPAVPLFLLGHSMGGLIALEVALSGDASLDGLALSAPAVLPGRVSPMTVLAGRVLSRVAPDVGVIALPLDKISRDPDVVAAYRADPLVFATKLRARLGAEMLVAMRHVDAALATLRVPLLVMQGSEDGIVARDSARFVYDRAGSPDKTIDIYPGLWHEIFNEPERDRVIGDLLEWLDAHRASRVP